MCLPACCVSLLRFCQVAFTERAKGIMGGLERSQKFLDVAKVGVCGKMKSLEVKERALFFGWSWLGVLGCWRRCRCGSCLM